MSTMRLLLILQLICVATSLSAQIDKDPEPNFHGDDQLRTVKVERFGVEARVPQAWRLITWAQDDQAFVLSIPQERRQSQGTVACELGLAPVSLQEYHKRHQQADAAERKKDSPKRILRENEIQKVDAKKFGATKAKNWGERLDSLWEIPLEDDKRHYELRTHIIMHEILYTFILSSDEEHFEAYRLDFEELLQRVKLDAPETGLKKLPSGHWMQTDFHFAMQLPDGWRPAFPMNEVLFFAKGQTHEVFTDNLLVLGSPKRKLDFDQLQAGLKQQIAQTMPNAAAEFKVIQFGAGNAEALETVVHFQQGPFALSVLEWRFSGPSRNYEVKFTAESKSFKQELPALRRALETFIEIAEEKPAETM
jgi:hypothetical protein